MPGRHRRPGDTRGAIPGEAYRVTLGTDADGTYSVSDCDIVRVGISTLTQNRTYTIDDVNAAVDPEDFVWRDELLGADYPAHDGGTIMRVSRSEDGSAFSLTVKDGPSGLTLCVLQSFASGGPSSCELVFGGLNWHVLSLGR